MSISSIKQTNDHLFVQKESWLFFLMMFFHQQQQPVSDLKTIIEQ